VEESPSPVIDAAVRSRLGEQVVRAMKAIGYRNAGTVEFLRDPQGRLYFMEMNTRLQVEHPVTEMVTGIDLVKEQIRLAAHHRLDLCQEDVTWQGHAIECRINAEDPDHDFRPDPGCITTFIPPRGDAPGKIRLDTHVEEGYSIPPFYDSMIGKLIVHAPTRPEAIATMTEALAQFRIEGIRTTIPLHRRIMAAAEFVTGNYDITFLDRLLAMEPAMTSPEGSVSGGSRGERGGGNPWPK
ncbi:MAG: hypothetical protein D6723_19350, partial [Acidobacteria bacterium]